MIPGSAELEEFHDRIVSIDAKLSKLGGEVSRSEMLNELAELSRMWLRYSVALRNGVDGYLPSLDLYDECMQEILKATKQRSRASAYRTRLKPFRVDFIDKVVTQLIRFEGSPAQASARQIASLFASGVSGDELTYVQEAAKCSAMHCHRAAIVMLWAAAVARMHTAVQRIGFARFNAAAQSSSAKTGQPFNRLTKGLSVTNLAELQRAREFDIIVVGIELWGLDLQAYEELDRLLGVRNSAAHPGMFSPTSIDVRVFAEKVRRFVFDLIN